MARDLSKLILQVNADEEREQKRFETRLAKRYKESYDLISSQIASLYETIGDPPSIEQARKYKRLDNLLKQIAYEYKGLTNKAIDETNLNVIRAYMNGYYGTQWAIDQRIEYNVPFSLVPVNAVRASIYDESTGATFEERFKNWSIRDFQKIKQDITRSLINGYSYAKTARQVRDDINTSYKQAIRIVRTEEHRNYIQGTLATFDEAQEIGIELKKQWVATLDQRTRADHGEADGQYADENGMFNVGGEMMEGPGMGNIPENNISCRCAIVADVDGLTPEFRRIRGEGIVPYKTYDQWATEKGWTKDGGWPKESKV